MYRISHVDRKLHVIHWIVIKKSVTPIPLYIFLVIFQIRKAAEEKKNQILS